MLLDKEFQNFDPGPRNGCEYFPSQVAVWLGGDLCSWQCYVGSTNHHLVGIFVNVVKSHHRPKLPLVTMKASSGMTCLRFVAAALSGTVCVKVSAT